VKLRTKKITAYPTKPRLASAISADPVRSALGSPVVVLLRVVVAMIVPLYALWPIP
jgi:hypothetical protein